MLKNIFQVVLALAIVGVLIAGCAGIFTSAANNDRAWKEVPLTLHVTPMKEGGKESFIITATATRTNAGPKGDMTFDIALNDQRARPMIADALRELQKKGAISVSYETRSGRGDTPMSLLVVINPPPEKNAAEK